ncbi:septal ring lytic transglycosylase RlpA family protein [Tolumonas lignilytica]|uniref:septal ring lytic transglycosylase RlpA family protein n=1 Tax=Tolumonas lignilytica TaxID=1283284 RepID=UPI000464D522|nr:septal ring lytic transglycosylase RlpA family protein [Tolumonas lignilytica]
MVINPYCLVYSFLALTLLAACSSQQNTTSSPPVTPQKPLIDVNGAIPRFEPPSRIGNTDYNVMGQQYKVWNGIQQYNIDGTASWYGPGFHGKYTSNGELYNQEDISAAHKNLPLPSYLRVTNLDNGRRLIVRVNDRGPFHGDRILDLSHGAASRLGIIGAGTAHVHVELLHPARPANADEIIAKHESRTIQLLATNNLSKAKQVASDVERRYGVPPRVVAMNSMYKLHLGPLEKPQAERLLSKLRGSGFGNAFFLN